MVCRNCGSAIPEGKLYCPFCGEEVFLVPEYSSVDMQRAKKRMEEEELLRQQKERELAEIEKRKENRLKPGTFLICAAIVIGLTAALTIGAVLLIMRNDSANYGLLMRKAQAALEVGQSDLALQYLMEAEAVMPKKSLELPLMKSEIMRDTGRYEDAEAILYELLTRSSSRTIYDRLICCLEEDEAYEEIASLLQRSRDPSLLEDYGAYVAEAPEMSLMNGDTYAFGTLLTLTCSGKGSIYYTVDWSEPDETSLLYEDSIPLQVGTNRIKAVFINEKGIKSPVSAAIFNVRRAPRTAA